VLDVTGFGATVAEAVAAAYRAVGHVHFDGMQVRRDIGAGQ
jgi:phosphoribosylamine--glycine ligase